MKKKQKIKRSTAERVLKETLERATHINTSSEFLWYIKEIYQFGSTLDETKEIVGDLDLFVELQRKGNETNDPDFKKQMDQQRAECKSSSFLDRLFYPYHKTLLYLKNRSRTLSLHDMSEFNQLDCKKKLIFKSTTVSY